MGVYQYRNKKLSFHVEHVGAGRMRATDRNTREDSPAPLKVGGDSGGCSGKSDREERAPVRRQMEVPGGSSWLRQGGGRPRDFHRKLRRAGWWSKHRGRDLALCFVSLSQSI